jgi:hypothetical protein
MFKGTAETARGRHVLKSVCWSLQEEPDLISRSLGAAESGEKHLKFRSKGAQKEALRIFYLFAPY